MRTPPAIALARFRSLTLVPAFAALLLVPVAAGAASKSLPGQHGPVHAQQPYLGIVFIDLNEYQSTALHVKGGVEIVLVDHDGPAGKIGLRPHDIIIRANGQVVPNSEALRRMIHDAGSGAAISLDVMRQSTSLTMTTQLADRDEVAREALRRMATVPDPPIEDAMPPMAVGPGFMEQGTTPPVKQSFLASMLHSTPFTGLAMDEMEPQLGNFFGAPQGVGLLVNTVLPNSPAASAGLHAGDIVLKADTMSLRSVADWTRYLHATRGRPIMLTVLRDKQSQVLTLQPELKKHSLLEFPKFF